MNAKSEFDLVEVADVETVEEVAADRDVPKRSRYRGWRRDNLFVLLTPLRRLAAP